jgi:hypothetical protein
MDRLRADAVYAHVWVNTGSHYRAQLAMLQHLYRGQAQIEVRQILAQLGVRNINTDPV